MKDLKTKIRKQLLVAVFAFTSALSIAIARFERDPQSCGLLVSCDKKKKEPS